MFLGHTIKPGTPEHRANKHRTPAEQLNITQNRSVTLHNTTEYQRNTSGTPRNNRTKNDCSSFKRKFKPQNFNFQLKFEIYLFIYLLFIYLFIQIFIYRWYK